VVEDENRMLTLELETSDAAELFKDTTVFSLAKPNKFVFQESFRISTYLYAIVAGPFDYHERQTEGLPRMRIYARKSLVADVNHSHMFDVTECGMWFYKDFFGKAYPFNKYD
jgi:aminopeptidase N